jgi:hypothetical protein
MAAGRYSEDFPPPQLLKEIRERLEGVCVDWPRSLFESVTARAAWIEFKYDRAMTDSFRTMSMRATHQLGRDSDGGDRSAPGGP